MLRFLRIATFLVCASTLPVGRQTQAADNDSLAFFAFDDRAIPWHFNTKVTMVQATKHPANPVLRRGPERSPDHGHAILYGTVIHDGGKFRMWYLGMLQTTLEEGQAPGWWRPMCYAESADGIHWVKPELGLVEHGGNTRNNICLVESKPYSLSRVDDFLSILYEPHDPDPSRRYKAAYIAHMPFKDIRGSVRETGRLCSFVCATSADGLKWRVVGDRPMNAENEHFEVSSLYHFGDMYYATGQVFEPYPRRHDGRTVGRVMQTYRSPDFDHWSRATALGFSRPGQTIAQPLAGQQTHMGAGLWNRGKVLLGFYGMWQDGPDKPPKGAPSLHGMRINLGLIISDDGIHFREPAPDFKIIPRGKEGEWDSVSLLQGNAFANVGDRTFVWYSHWDNEDQFRNQEIGLATFRRDGFGYLSRQEARKDGQCITANIPASSSGYGLKVNVDGVSRDNPLTVELLDASGRPIPEFSGEKAAKITEPGVDRAVVFPDQPDSRSPRSQPFAIQIGFPSSGDVRLYAVYASR